MSSKFFFFYDTAGQLIGEYRDNASTTTPTDDWLVRQETIWLENIPVAVIKKATATSPILTYFIHADHLNTPRVIMNQSNTPVWRWENTHAFGANLPDEDPDGNGQLFEYHPRFPGQYFDKETNLHYNYFRYYEPETGRYISPDPIGLAGGLNVYGYAEQDPLSFTDPTGENPVLLWALSGALTLWDMLKPMQPNSQYPDAIEPVWTVPGPVGSAKNLCRFTNDVPRDPIILGENMKRVQAYANKIGGKTINDFNHSKNWSIENNEIWLKETLNNSCLSFRTE
ncbi:MAG: RHS repeat-associated core domain-containing protein [Nitrosomonas sp.]